MKQRGFTLLEVLVAFAILVTAGAALFEATGTALALHAKARDISQATLVAESLMAEIDVTKGAPGPQAATVGECESQVETKPWRSAAPGGSPVEVRVRVKCGGSEVVLTTVHLGTR